MEAWVPHFSRLLREVGLLRMKNPIDGHGPDSALHDLAILELYESCFSGRKEVLQVA
jgi:hypothetical protein